MALRKAASYSKIPKRPYTRKSTKKARNYIKTVPPQKVVRFKMGAIQDYEAGKFATIIRLVTAQAINIRDNALESARQYIHHRLDEELAGQYYFEVRVYPHHILRENKTLTGAGADRMQTGMAHSYGTTMGRAAILKPNQEIYLLAVNGEKARKIVFDVLGKIKSKLPCHVRIAMQQ